MSCSPQARRTADGGNMPGSGNLPLNCDDGGFGEAYSVDFKFENGPSMPRPPRNCTRRESQQRRHRLKQSDLRLPLDCRQHRQLISTLFAALLLDCAEFTAPIPGEYPQPRRRDPPPTIYRIANETAFKVGAPVHVCFGLTVSGIYEYMHRSCPAALEFQNERQRTACGSRPRRTFHPG